jgi:hypothetical protein
MSEVVAGDPMITAGNNEAPTDHEKRLSPQSELDSPTAAVVEKVRSTLATLGAELKPHYDFIVCGSGSSGSVVAGRQTNEHGNLLTSNPETSGRNLK